MAKFINDALSFSPSHSRPLFVYKKEEIARSKANSRRRVHDYDQDDDDSQ